MYNRSASMFCLILLSILVKVDISVVGMDRSQLSSPENSAQSPMLLARVVHDSDDRSPPREEKV
jgi:hypothetical protein